MRVSYYIYYRVPAAAADKVRAAVAQLQRTLARVTGVAGRLLCRRDKPETWMEIYEDVEDDGAFERVLDRELLDLQFSALLGPENVRRTEIFRPL